MIAAPLVRYALGALAAFVLLAAAYAYVDHKGYQRAAAHYEAAIAAERAAIAEADANEQRRQTIANNAAKKREAEAIAAIQAAESEIEELRKEQRREALQDPDAGRTALGRDSVQRINKIR